MTSSSSQNDLIFTLNDDAVPATALSEAAEEFSDWEQNLARLQQKRRHHQRAPEAKPEKQPVFTLDERPAAASVRTNAIEAAVEAQLNKQAQRQSPRARQKLSLEEQKRSYLAYLAHQQSLQNQAQPEDAPLDNPQIIFQEDWLSAQSALNIGQNEPSIGAATVWVSARGQTVTEGKSVLDRLNALEQATDASAERVADEAEDAEQEPVLDEAALIAAAEKIVVLNVYGLPERVNQKILAMSEANLLHHLAEKLRPHLADAVSGMLKIAIQRQTAAMIHQLQASLAEEVPQLVDDVLRHNLSRAVAAVKRDLK